MAADAAFRAAGTGPPVALRVMIRTPDEVANFGSSRIVTETLLVDAQVADLAAVARGDTLTIGGTVWTVLAAPTRDRERLLWHIELVKS